jgi:hypothetical protein
MKSRRKKIVIVVIAGLVLLFLCYNLIWFLWSHLKYDRWTEGMKPFRKGISYVLEGEDEYLYNLKYPDYLQFGGNICVATKDQKYALLIWPQITGGYEYGVQIESDGTLWSIMVTKDMKAVRQIDEEILVLHREEINQLNVKAREMWDL